MTVIDTHLHLDESIAGPAQAAVDSLAEALAAAGIERGVVLQLRGQRWSAAEVAAALDRHPRLIGCVHIDPRATDAADTLARARDDWGYRGLKLHPRLDGYAADDPATIALVRRAGELAMPVVIDAFPDGDWLLAGGDVLAYGRLGRACPATGIVVAHMGGHKVLDLMMVAKRVPNLHMDTSYSLLYYRGSSVPADLTYAIKSMRCQRIFYGSDHPDRGVAETLEASRSVLGAHGIDGADLDRILFANAAAFFPWD